MVGRFFFRLGKANVGEMGRFFAPGAFVRGGPGEHFSYCELLVGRLLGVLAAAVSVSQSSPVSGQNSNMKLTFRI